MPLTVAPKLLIALYRVLGLVLAVTGALKLLSISSFSASLRRLVPLPSTLAIPTGLLLCSIELVLGIGLLLAPQRSSLRLYAAFLFGSFLVAHIIAMVRNTGACGCFGSDAIPWLARLEGNHGLLGTLCILAIVSLSWKVTNNPPRVVLRQEKKQRE